MKKLIGNDWDEVLAPAFESEKYQELRDFLKEEYQTKQIFPDMYHIFTAFKLTSFADTKVVILGQDPYHNPGQATGMSFSVNPGVPLPPSLKNIYKEKELDAEATTEFFSVVQNESGRNVSRKVKCFNL